MQELCWVEEEDNKSFRTDTKSSQETNANDLPKDLSADNGEIESEIPDMDWIDALSDPIEENSIVERLVDSETSPQASGKVAEASENGNQQDSASNDKIFTMKNEIDSDEDEEPKHSNRPLRKNLRVLKES